MSFLNKSNMVDGNIIPASDITQIVDAFTYSGSYDLLISGSVAIGTSSISNLAKVYIKQNLRVDGGITGSFTGSFIGNGSGITNVISASYALSGSYAQTSSYTQNTLSSSYAVTASYALNSVPFDSSSFLTIAAFNDLSSSFVSTSSFNIFSSSYSNDSGSFLNLINISLSPHRISSGSTTVTTYSTGNVIVSGSSNLQFIVSGSGSFTGTVQAVSYFQNSLKILKENILPFSSSAVEIINDLNIVTYNYKKHKELFKIGIIADDTHEYISTKEKNVLDTSNSIGLLFKAIQELYKDNCELRSIISKNAYR